MIVRGIIIGIGCPFMVLGWAEGRRVEWLVNLLYYRKGLVQREKCVEGCEV